MNTGPGDIIQLYNNLLTSKFAKKRSWRPLRKLETRETMKAANLAKNEQ